MFQFLRVIVASPWFNLFSFLGGLAIARWSVWASKVGQSPRFRVRHFPLVTEEITSFPQLEVSFKGQRVQRFTWARVAFWNGGRSTLKRGDVAKKAPIHIKLAEGALLMGAALESATDESNEVTVKRNGNTVEIDFEYLDPQQGAIVALAHDGAAKHPIEVLGRVHGSPLIDDDKKRERIMKYIERVLSVMMDPVNARFASASWPAKIVMFVPYVITMMGFIFVGICVFMIPLGITQGLMNMFDRQTDAFRKM